MDRAIQALDRLGATAQRVHNTLLASEAWFEIAQILREKQNKIEASMDYYRRAVEVSRHGLSIRQQRILEHSLYHLAEYEYLAERWSAALDRVLPASVHRMIFVEGGTLVTSAPGRSAWAESKEATDGEEADQGVTDRGGAGARRVG